MGKRCPLGSSVKQVFGLEASSSSQGLDVISSASRSPVCAFICALMSALLATDNSGHLLLHVLYAFRRITEVVVLRHLIHGVQHST